MNLEVKDRFIALNHFDSPIFPPNTFDNKWVVVSI